eukprot:m.867291 g.867291  ORF g.867291 m.867291 type:complete len:142 (+) comp59726_c1_seq2:436-861(+)
MFARASFKETTTAKPDWVVMWGNHHNLEFFKDLEPAQLINHFPGSFEIGRKDRLWKAYSKFQAKFGRQEYDFLPETFCLPGDLPALKSAWLQSDQATACWIKKPVSCLLNSFLLMTRILLNLSVIGAHTERPRSRAWYSSD